MKKKYIYFCQNCGKEHNIKICSEPKNSLGIILYKNTLEPGASHTPGGVSKNIKFLMIKRKNTIGFVQFIRGQYLYSDIAYIQKLFNVMTNYEIELIQQKNFSELWEFLWMDKFYNNNHSSLKRKKKKSEQKFLKMVNGIKHNDETYTIGVFIERKKVFYEEQEWGFPKGRRNKYETNIDTALREFNEETNIPLNEIRINHAIGEIIEEYKSYDNVIYKNIYYICEYLGSKKKFDINVHKREQFMEISDIRFMDKTQAIEKIRPYLIEKKKILNEIYEILIKTLK
tara:strand:- start:31935 stop:32789 length:855 start_codon:yes stop_codon:yes gene_type:complete